MDSHSASPCETLGERYQTLLEVAQAISAQRDIHELFRHLAQRLPRVVHVNFVTLSLHDPVRKIMRLHTIQANVPADLVGGHEEPVEETPAGSVWQTQQPLFVTDLAEEHRWPTVTQRMREDGTQSFCAVPLTTAVRRLGAMGFASLLKGAYRETDMEFLQQVGNQVAVAVDNVLHYQDLTCDRDRLHLLLEVSESIALHHDLTGLFQDLAKRLPVVAPFDFIGLVLHDHQKNVMKVHVLETAAAHPLTHRMNGLELPIEESASGWVWTYQQPLNIPALAAETRFTIGMEVLRGIGVESLCLLPLTTAMRRLGAIGFGSLKRSAFSAADANFLQQVADQIAVAVGSTLNYEQAQEAQRQLARERDHLRFLLEVNNAMVATLDLKQLLQAIATSLRRVIPHERTALLMYEPDQDQFRLHTLEFEQSKALLPEGDVTSVEGSPAGVALRSRNPVHFTKADLQGFRSEVADRLLAEGIQSVYCIPLLSHDRALGVLTISSLTEDMFELEDRKLFCEAAKQISLAVENALVYGELTKLKEKLSEEKLYLEEEIQTEYNFEEIVGDSQALKRVLKQVKTVAATDSTVLILGETGSGKELVARALHNLGGRRERTFVKLNCAAIPTGLLESELFGHEKGAFTGAIATKIGRFELADRGTLFLDEVGEIPLELQVKLLRVLQEQEFERLGSTRTIRVNVRMIAATNRDLGQMVEDHTFRSDLYYRLNVFPVTVPPLRDRAEDIPSLVRHFAQKFAQRMKKRIETIPSESMKALQAYHWPGNVRELENFVERAVILTTGPDLFVSLSELKRTPGPITTSGISTLEQAEREHIIKVLRESNWAVGGAVGAAARLGMKRTTLQSKMQKLGIARPS